MVDDAAIVRNGVRRDYPARKHRRSFPSMRTFSIVIAREGGRSSATTSLQPTACDYWIARLRGR
jgi:hypothetical protein